MPEFAAVFLRRAWPAVIVIVGWLGYSVWIFAANAANGEVPSPQINSIIVALAVICSVFAATYIVVGAVGVSRRCDCTPEVEGLREAVCELQERTAPQRDRVYVAASLGEPITEYLEDAAQLYDLGRRAEQERRRREDDEGTTPV